MFRVTMLATVVVSGLQLSRFRTGQGHDPRNSRCFGNLREWEMATVCADQGRHPRSCHCFGRVKVAILLLSQGFAQAASRILHAHEQVSKVIDSMVVFYAKKHEQL